MGFKIVRADHKFGILGFYTSIRFSWDESFVFNGESHNFWEAVCVLSGEVEITEDEKVYHLGADHIILHAPMEFHRIRSHNGTHPTGLILSFAAEGELPETLKNGVFSLSIAERERYKEIFDRIYRCVKDKEGNVGEYAPQAASHLLSSFLLDLAGSSDNAAHNRFEASSPTALLYKKIVSSMQENICTNLTLLDVAKKNNISISYLKLLFQKYAGVSPKLFYTRLRLHHAQELLGKGIPISEIAEKMAFSSPNYFSEFFKRNTGLSPSEFKNGERHILR